MKRVPLLLAILAAGLLAPAVLASGFLPPEGSHTATAGPVEVAHWVGPAPSVGEVNETVAEGETGTLWFGVEKSAANDTNATPGTTFQRAYVNLTSDDLAFGNASLVITTDLLTSLVWDYANTTFTVADANATNATYNFTVEVYREDANGTVLLGAASGTGTVAVARAPVVPPPVEPGVPTTWIVGGGAAVLVVGGGAALYAMQKRRERRLMNLAPRRSAVMREMELERQLERAQEKDPEAAAEIKQEIRAQEQVREKRRELQILEAKRADVLKGLDLLRKRHEAGGLTKLQYDNMVAKKQQDLQRIEAEIADMESREPPGGAAA